MADIFLSYTRTDRDRVAPIAALLEARGWTVWSDTRIDAGEQWDEVIEREVDAASCVVAIWSARSVGSRWVRTEAGEGLERGILVPVLIDSTKPPLEFRRIHAIDLTGWKGGADEHPARMLVGAVARLFGLGLPGEPSATARADAVGRARERLRRQQAGPGLIERIGDWGRSAVCRGARLASDLKAHIPQLARRSGWGRGIAVLSGFLAALIVAGATVLWSKAWQGYDAAQVVPDPQRADVVLALSQLHIGNGEIVRARELLAANKSLAPDRIALALGETYDPGVLDPWGEGGVPADADRARSLYLEAQRFGSQTAKKRLEDLAKSRASAERTLGKGMELLEEGQIAAARGCFLYAHRKGLAAGAFMMAATFDPHVLKRAKVIGFGPDPAQARVWYERAHDLGHPEAGIRLRRLAAPP